MHIYTLKRTQVIPRPIDETFAFFADVANLEAITPDWLHFQILTSGANTMRAGTLIDYRLRWRWVPIRWQTEIRSWGPPFRFVDAQLRGPYQLWEHEHTFEAVAEGTLMRDVVRYALPFGFLGRLAHCGLVRRDLDSIFDYRTRKVATLLGLELTHA
jgi:hypothetical protein